jgi:hypothetical protein
MPWRASMRRMMSCTLAAWEYFLAGFPFFMPRCPRKKDFFLNRQSRKQTIKNQRQ